jgi:hypothetical protein
MECSGTTDFDNNGRLITLFAIIISGLHCINQFSDCDKHILMPIFPGPKWLQQQYLSLFLDKYLYWKQSWISPTNFRQLQNNLLRKQKSKVHFFTWINVRIFFMWRCGPTRAMASSFSRFLDKTQWGITVCRTPLDEWSAHHRDLYLTTHNTHNRQTTIPPAGFKPTIPVS